MTRASWRQLPESPWDILGVDSNATLGQIRVARKVLILRVHPDRNLDDPDAVERMKVITWAFDVVTDPAQVGDARRHFHPASPAPAPAGLTYSASGDAQCETSLPFRDANWGKRRNVRSLPDLLVHVQFPELPTPFFTFGVDASKWLSKIPGPRGTLTLSVHVDDPTDADRESFLSAAVIRLRLIAQIERSVDGTLFHDRFDRLREDTEWIVAACSSSGWSDDSDTKWRAAQLSRRGVQEISALRARFKPQL